MNTFAQCGQNDLASVTAKRCVHNEIGELCATKIPGSLNNIENVLDTVK